MTGQISDTGSILHAAASASSELTPINGILSEYANVFAVVTPILRPVYEPGPFVTAIRSKSAGAISAADKKAKIIQFGPDDYFERIKKKIYRKGEN